MDIEGPGGGQKRDINFLVKWILRALAFMIWWWSIGLLILGGKTKESSVGKACIACGFFLFITILLLAVATWFPSRAAFGLYLVLQIILIIYQFGLVIAMFARENKYLNIFQDPVAREKFQRAIQSGRGALVFFLICQVVAVVFGGFAMSKIEKGASFMDFKTHERHMGALDDLVKNRQEKDGGTGSFGQNYGKIRGKLQDKYKKYAHFKF